MPSGDAFIGGEGDSVQSGGGSEDTLGEDGVEFEVLGHLVGVDAELVGAVLREVVLDVFGCDVLEVVALLDLCQLLIEVGVRGTDEGGDDIGGRIGVAGGLIVDGERRVGGVSEQMRLQCTQRRGVCHLGAGVAVAAAGSARHRVVQHVPTRLC